MSDANGAPPGFGKTVSISKMVAPPVDQVMTTRLVTLEPHSTVGKAIRLIEDLEVRHLPVLRDGRLVGIVSDRDLREYRTPGEDPREANGGGKTRLGVPVSEVMTRDLIWVESGQDLTAAIDAMLQFGIGAVPVVDPETQGLMGIVSYVDVLQVIRASM